MRNIALFALITIGLLLLAAVMVLVGEGVRMFIRMCREERMEEEERKKW